MIVDYERWRALNSMLLDTEELLAKPLRGICVGASIFGAGAGAFLIAAFWGPFSWLDLTLAAVSGGCAVWVERYSRREYWRDQATLEALAEQIKADMRRCTRGE